jgi:hypothetical protein
MKYGVSAVARQMASRMSGKGQRSVRFWSASCGSGLCVYVCACVCVCVCVCVLCVCVYVCACVCCECVGGGVMAYGLC